MSKWDKPKKSTWTKQDNFLAYLKMGVMVVLALFYVYLLT